MHVLIADALAPEARDGLQTLGLRVTEQPTLHVDSLPGAITGVHILVVGETHVSRRTIENADNLSLIVRASSGTGTIDVAAASQNGIFVSHCPGYDGPARAELVLGMVLALDRGIGAEQSYQAPAEGLRDRILGLYGFSDGAAAVQRAASAFGLQVCAYSGALTTSLASEAGVRLCGSADDLFRRSDIVWLDPDGPDPGVVATAARLAMLGDGAIIVNTGDPGLIDLDAARARVDAGTLRLGFDTPGEQAPLAGMPGVVTLPGVASATRQARATAAATVVRIITEYLVGDSPPNCVNLEQAGTGPAMLIVRHRNKVGVLVSVLEVLKSESINVLEIGNVLFSDAEAACARLRVSAVPSPSVLDRIRRNEAVFQVDLVTTKTSPGP